MKPSHEDIIKSAIDLFTEMSGFSKDHDADTVNCMRGEFVSGYINGYSKSLENIVLPTDDEITKLMQDQRYLTENKDDGFIEGAKIVRDLIKKQIK